MPDKDYLTDEDIFNDKQILTYVSVGSHPYLLFRDVNDFKIEFFTADDPKTVIEIPKQALYALGKVVTELGEKFTK